MLTTILSSVAGVATTWMKRKGEKDQAKHEVKVAKINGAIDADVASSKAMSDSLKDEWFTLLLSIPCLIVFYAAIAGNLEMIEQIKLAFEVMGQLPDWYTWAFTGAIAASFGIRTFDKFGPK